MTTTKKIKVAGSIKNKITATELEEERKNCDFDKREMTRFFWHDMSVYKMFQDEADLMEKHPEYGSTHKFYEWTPQEI